MRLILFICNTLHYMKHGILLLLSALILFTAPVKAQDSSICYLRDVDGRIREHNVDFIKMLLDVKFNTALGKVTGNVKYDFKPIQYITDTLFLDAPGIDIKKVLLNGKETPFKVDSAGVTIRFMTALDWNREYKLDISYEATPHKGIYFIGWNVTEKNTNNDPYFTRKQIWTQGQGTDNRFWFPCYDDVNDKLITETLITFDSSYTVVSNGVLKGKKLNTNGTYTWNYAMNKPMVPYLVMIAIDKFTYKDYKSKNGMVSRQYYYSDRPQVVEPTYRYSAEMMDWLATDLQVKYPWETYANVPVQDFMYGAMENTTATIYGDFYQTDARAAIERGYVATNTHELTHQWFGDYITEYSAQHHWLHESFATYYAKQFVRKVYGEDYYQMIKRDEQNNAIRADNNDRFPVGHSHGGSARHYPKGSFVVDMLRYVVGDSVFNRCITNYLKKHAYSNVDNHAFKMAFIETAGINLDWFFDQWVYRAGIPHYNVSYQLQNNQVAVFVNQSHKVDELTSYFRMPIVFEAYFSDGSSSTVKQWISHQNDTVYLNAPAGKQVSYVLFDPGNHVLKTVSFPKTFEELKAQATGAKHMLDRYDAIAEMTGLDYDTKRDFLIKHFERGDYNMVLTDLLGQLGSDTNAATVQLFKKAAHHTDFLVRRAVIEKLKNIPDEILVDAEQLLTDTSYYTIEAALRKLYRQHPEKAAQYLQQVKGLRGINNNVRIAYLELSYKQNTATPEELNELAHYISNSYEFRTRVKAMEAVERIQFSNSEVLTNLLNAALYTNNRINGPATRTLKLLIQKPENMQTAKGIFELTPWTDRERVILERILK